MHSLGRCLHVCFIKEWYSGTTEKRSTLVGHCPWVPILSPSTLAVRTDQRAAGSLRAYSTSRR